MAGARQLTGQRLDLVEAARCQGDGRALGR
jgi:hypothetical protein